MKKEINGPVGIALVVVIAVLVIGYFVMKSNGPGDGARPSANAGGIKTSGGKVLPVAAGSGGGG